MNKIKVTTYEQDRLYFFVDQVSLAQKKYNRLFKTFKDAPYLSEGAQFLSDAGRELQFYKDVVEMLDKGCRKQEWISVENGLPEDGNYITYTNAKGKDNGVVAQRLVTTTIRGETVRRWEWMGRVSPWIVTHYMSLPEPPKMKGGAE